MDKVIVKGKAQAHEIYELLGPSENVSETTKLFKTDYERAYNHYLNRDFSGAMKYQESIDPLFQKEKSAQLLKETCDSFMKNAPNDDWKGIRIFK